MRFFGFGFWDMLGGNSCASSISANSNNWFALISIDVIMCVHWEFQRNRWRDFNPLTMEIVSLAVQDQEVSGP